eukprot:1158149-Pelagomonas_calceolata.AAC.5
MEVTLCNPLCKMPTCLSRENGYFPKAFSKKTQKTRSQRKEEGDEGARNRDRRQKAKNEGGEGAMFKKERVGVAKKKEARVAEYQLRQASNNNQGVSHPAWNEHSRFQLSQ